MNSQKQSRKTALEGLPRKKLYSLRFLNPKYHQAESARHDPEVFKKLQRSLARDNNEQQPIAEPNPVFPDEVKEEDNQTLWQCFLEQASKVQGKVQSERVNCYQRQYNRLKRQIERQISTLQLQIQRLESVTKEKYKQIHSYYEQIKLEKVDISIQSPLLKTKQSRKTEPSLISQNHPKITALRESIQSVRKEVEGLEQEINAIKARQTQSRRQWLFFLKSILREGYYLRKGVIPILEEMVALNYVPILADLPYCLDDVSKRCLLLQYQQLRSNAHKIDSQPLTTRISSQPKSKLIGITEKQLTRDIYKETKQMMFSLIQATATKQQFTLPPILPAKAYKERSDKNDWRTNERRRLSHIYEGQKYTLSRSILFGPKVQIL